MRLMSCNIIFKDKFLAYIVIILLGIIKIAKYYDFTIEFILI